MNLVLNKKGQMKVILKNSSILMLLFLYGCQNNSMLDLQEFVENTHKGKSPSIEPLPVPKPHPTHKYSASGLNDPFDVTNIAPQKAIELKDPRNSLRRKEELEAFNLDGIKVVGTMSVSDVDWAVVSAPDGTIHRVKRGNYMGENDGRIDNINIDEQKVTLVEDVQSATGEWIEREVFLSVGDE